MITGITSLSEKIVVGGHGCHKALNVGVKSKESQDKVLALYWLHKLYQNTIKPDLLPILVFVLQQIFFLNCKLHVFLLSKTCYQIL